MGDQSPATAALPASRQALVKERPASGRSIPSVKSSPAANYLVAVPDDGKSARRSARRSPASPSVALGSHHANRRSSTSLQSSTNSRPLDITSSSASSALQQQLLRTTTSLRSGCGSGSAPVVSLTANASERRVLEGRARLAQCMTTKQWCISLTDSVLTRNGANVELSQRALGSLPCLHAPPPFSWSTESSPLPTDPSRETPHGSGNELVSAVESLNLRNNSMVSLTAGPRHSEGVNDSGDGGMAAPIVPCSLSLFSHVTSLDVTNNELVSLTGVGQLPNLTSLRAARNSIKSLSSLWRSPYIAKLEYLEVSANQLTEILTETDGAKLTAQNVILSLRTLSATSNSIRELSDTVKLFPHLAVLKLRRNRIESVAACFPACCPALASVDLNTNCLDEVTAMAPLKARMGSQVKLDLGQNTPALKIAPRRPSFERSTEASITTTALEDSASASLQASPVSSSSPAAHSISTHHASPLPGGSLSPDPPVTAAVKRPATALRRAPSHSDPCDTGSAIAAPSSQRRKPPPGSPEPAPPSDNCAAKPDRGDATIVTAATLEDAVASPTTRTAAAAGTAEVRGVTRVDTNVWCVDVKEVVNQLSEAFSMSTAKKMLRCSPATVWANAPRLTLPYTDTNVISSPPALKLEGIPVSATRGPDCQTVIHFILRSVVMERETMLTRALKRYDMKISCSGAASPASAASGGRVGGATKGSPALACEVSGGTGGGFPALLMVDHTFDASAAPRHDPWPFLRWRREFETQAAMRGLRVQSRFWLPPNTSYAGSACVPPEKVPVPALWEQLYAEFRVATRSLSGPVIRKVRDAPRSPPASSRGTRRGDDSAPDGSAHPSETLLRWRVPAAFADCDGVSGCCVVWPVPLIARVIGGLSTPMATAANATALASTTSAGEAILELAMGTLAANVRARTETEVDVDDGAATSHVATEPPNVYTMEDIMENKKARLAELAQAENAMEAGLASVTADAGSSSWEGVAVSIPCAAFHPFARQSHADANVAAGSETNTNASDCLQSGDGDGE